MGADDNQSPSFLAALRQYQSFNPCQWAFENAQPAWVDRVLWHASTLDSTEVGPMRKAVGHTVPVQIDLSPVSNCGQNYNGRSEG